MIGSISWLLLDKLLRVASGVFVSTLVARHLGPADYGALALAIGAVGVASAAANMGADHLNQSELARAADSTFLTSAFAVRMIVAVVCALCVLAAATLLDAPSAPLYAALTGSVLAMAPMVCLHQLYADNRFRTASLLGMGCVLIGAAARIAGWLQAAPATWFGWCLTVESALLSVGAMACVRLGRGARRPGGFSRAEALRYARLCAPTLASALLIALYFRLELFVVGAVLGSTATGTWAAAMMFILPWNMVSAAVLPVVNRRLNQSVAGSDADAASMRRLMRVMLALAVAAALLNMIAVHWVVPLLLGPRYGDAAEIAMICSLSLLPLFLGAVQDVSLARRRLTTVVLRKVLFGLPLSLALLGLGASQWGLHGVAVGMVASYTLTAVALNAWLDRDYFQLQVQALRPAHG